MVEPLISQILGEVTNLKVDITERREGENLNSWLQGSSNRSNAQEVSGWVRSLDAEKKLRVAQTYKTKGDIEMKFKKYFKAMVFYGEAIKACANDELLDTLLGKRIEAECALGDYSAALQDAVRALDLKPDNLEMRWRSAENAYKTRLFDASAKFCAEVINATADQSDESLLLIREQAKELQEKAYLGLETFKRLCEELKRQAINFAQLNEGECLTEEFLRPKIFMLENWSVRFDDEDSRFLKWPAVLVFPDLCFHMSVKCIHDFDTLADFLDNNLPTHLPRDIPLRKQFMSSANLNIYSKNTKENYFFKINAKSSIKEIVQDKRFFVVNGVLLFLIELKITGGLKKRLNLQ